jgi:hypothetical protein
MINNEMQNFGGIFAKFLGCIGIATDSLHTSVGICHRKSGAQELLTLAVSQITTARAAAEVARSAEKYLDMGCF